MSSQTTDAPKGDAGCAKPTVHQPFGASIILILLARDLLSPRQLGPVGKNPKLAAPHCVAGFRVRPDFHRIDPLPGILAARLSFSPGFGLPGKLFHLAAPQCVAGLRVRLYFHRISPFLGFLPFAYFWPWFWTTWEASRISCPTLRCQLSRSSLLSLDCSFPGILTSSAIVVLSGSSRTSCPTLRCQLSCSSLLSSDCSFLPDLLVFRPA